MEISTAARLLAGLGNPARLRILGCLIPHGSAGKPAGDIGRELRLPPATLSFHLKELASIRAVSARRQGRSILYSVEPSVIGALTNYLLAEYLSGGGALSSPGADPGNTKRADGQHSAPSSGDPKPTIRPKWS
jgi:ArsR family transcriptional regulator, arsenate/arsenite/antimonite-responsive transcriptional repressor